MKKITSLQNNIIKETVRLKNTRERKESKLIVSEGIKLTHELIRCGFETVFCFISEHTEPSVLPCEIDNDIIFVVSDHIMKKLTTLNTPPDVITVAKERESVLQLNDEPLILALDSIQDPSNMGAIFRSAEAFGVKNIVLGDGCCDCFSQKVLRSSMGSVLRLNIIRTSLEKYIISHRDKYTVIGTGLDKKYKTVDKLYESKNKIIIIGNEGNGISKPIQDMCDFGMYIPMKGENESLNAAVAASIILWEDMRQNNER